MRCVRHVTLVVSSLAALMLACSSPDSAAIGPKDDAPPVAGPSGSDSGAAIPIDDGGDGGVAPNDGGQPDADGGITPKEAGVAAHIQANVRFLLKSVAPSEPLLPDTSYDLTFEIGIHSSHTETFQLVPRIDPGWTAVVAGLDTIDATVASAVAGLTVTKVVTVTTGASGSGSLVLDLKAKHFAEFDQSSQPTSLTIGATPTIPDGVIQPISVVGLGPAAFQSNTFLVPQQPAGGARSLLALMIFEAAGTYHVSPPLVSPSSDWTVQRSSSATITTNAANVTSMVSFAITPKSTGGQYDAADGELSVTITSDDGTHSLPFTARLHVVP